MMEPSISSLLSCFVRTHLVSISFEFLLFFSSMSSSFVFLWPVFPDIITELMGESKQELNDAASSTALQSS